MAPKHQVYGLIDTLLGNVGCLSVSEKGEGGDKNLINLTLELHNKRWNTLVRPYPEFHTWRDFDEWRIRWTSRLWRCQAAAWDEPVKQIQVRNMMKTYSNWEVETRSFLSARTKRTDLFLAPQSMKPFLAQSSQTENGELGLTLLKQNWMNSHLREIILRKGDFYEKRKRNLLQLIFLSSVKRESRVRGIPEIPACQNS